FHADGLRVDAVSSMLYYDFGKGDGQWLPNKYGGRENLDAISFIKQMNEVIHRDFPGVIIAAEESSAYPLVTKPTHMGGLGFGFKWNMGWMNDTLAYMEMDPIYRKWHHDKLTFSLYYAFSENYILPFSHDEVVHGKRSMLDKQPGDLWQKFSSLRALYGYTMAHPGKKLLFMGSEFGHFIEWKYDDQLDWFLLVYERHPELQQYVKKLNHFYQKNPAFYEIEDSWEGFQWLTVDDKDNSIIAFVRSDKKGKSIVCVINFTPNLHVDYRIGLPTPGTLKELLNSDQKEFGGSGQVNPSSIKSTEIPLSGFSDSVLVRVPPLSCVYYSYSKTPVKKKALPSSSKKVSTAPSKHQKQKSPSKSK
ncbi:MAG: 1,4-alpha-glucan branching enzyme, partial [Clostridiales bacterium]|nr:1,4-alpha-glucan branching enzyme [Clostridiales bacterium]